MSAPIMYPITTMRRHNRKITVWWAGWTGTAMLMRAEPSHIPRWVAVEAISSLVTPLPSPAMMGRDGDGAGPRPDAWAPLGDWPDALGEPLPHQPHHDTRMGEINRGGYTAADAAQEAEEMEADREEARRNPGQTPRENLPWWRITEAVTYSPPGQIGEHEAEGRLMRALYFLGGTDRRPTYRSNAAIIADLKGYKEPVAREDATGSYVPRLQTTPADTADRLLQAMRWYCELELTGGATPARIMDDRALNVPRSFADIARFLDPPIKRQAAQQAYARGIAAITRIANAGTPVVDHLLAQTQTRNRTHALTR